MRHSRLLALVCPLIFLVPAVGHSAISDIADAAMARDGVAVGRLLERNVDVNEPQADGATALHWAARWNDADMAAMLIRAGADVSARNRLGVSPMDLACLNGSPTMIRILLEAGVDPNRPSDTGETPLMLVARTGNAGAVRVLLEYGAKADAAEASQNQTALMWAAAEGHTAAVGALIEGGADVNARSWVEVTPAGRGGNTQRTAFPAPGTDEDVAFRNAEATGDSDARLGAFLEFEHRFPESILLVEAYQQVARIYRDRHDPDNASAVRDRQLALERDLHQRSSAQLAYSGGITPLLLAAREGHLESARLLVEAGADLDLSMANRTGPLVMAIQNAHYRLARYLLAQGADPDLADENGKAALYAAVDMRNMATTDTPGPTNDKEAALELIDALLANGANPNARLTQRPPFRGGANRTWFYELGATPFYRAAASGDVTVMRMLLAHGADPNVAASDHTTPLMVASGIGYLHDSTFSWPDAESLAALKLCLETGDVHAANQAGLTALHGAAFRGWNAGVVMLVGRGAELDAQDLQGRTPLDWADGVYRGGGIAPVRQLHTIALLEALIEAQP